MTGNMNRKNLKSSYFHLVTTGCIGIVLAVILFFTVRGWEQRQIMAEFEHDVEMRISSLREQIKGNIHELDVLRAFYEGSHNVERNEFRTFVKHILSHVPSIQALEWIPHLSDSRRLDYEEKARKDGFPDFRITERDANGKLVKASRRKEYFPVYFVEPYEGNEAALGFDLASNAVRLNALNQSRESGKIVASSRIKLVQGKGSQYGFLVFVPIFDQIESADTAGLRQKNLKGFVLGVFRIDAIVEEALRYLETKGIDVYLFDRSAPGGEQFLYHRSAATNSGSGKLNNVNLAEIRTGNFMEDTLTFGSKEWLALFKIKEDYYSIYNMWKQWVAAIIVLIVTALIFLIQNRYKKERQATAKILVAKNNLELEIVRRRQAEKAHIEEKKQLEKIQEKLEGAYEELVQTQSKMIHQEKMASVGQLAAGVAHEINNPTGFITSNLGTLNMHTGALAEFINELTGAVDQLNDENLSCSLKEKRKQLDIDYILEDIEPLIRESLDGTERVKKIVQNLKSFSRVDESEYKFADINECMESTLNIIWNELKYKTTVEKEFGSLPSTKCYPQQLNQVFMNILINAAQAIEKQGVIKIRTWNSNGFINVSISDTGQGIAEKNLSSIFDPFFTTKEVGKGTGLGLSICYEIIKKHNGEITASSELGKGTTFEIKIPVVEGNDNG